VYRSTVAFTLLTLAVGALALLPGGCATTAAYQRADGSIDGRLVYERKCSQCHELWKPGDHSDAEWADAVASYGPRAGVRPEWRPALVAWLQEANDGAAGRERSP
jgi:hypothetical protein